MNIVEGVYKLVRVKDVWAIIEMPDSLLIGIPNLYQTTM